MSSSVGESEKSAKNSNLLILPRSWLLLVEASELLVDLHAVDFAQHFPLSNFGPGLRGNNCGLVAFLVLAATRKDRKIRTNLSRRTICKQIKGRLNSRRAKHFAFDFNFRSAFGFSPVCFLI